MVSGFVCAKIGRLLIPKEDVGDFMAWASEQTNGARSKIEDFPHSAKMCPGCLSGDTMFEPGKNKGGWWVGEDVVAQTKEVVLIAGFLMNQADNIEFQFVHDNSSNHCCFAPSALRVRAGVNLNPGGKKAPGA